MARMPFKDVSEASEYYRDLARKAIVFAFGVGVIVGFCIGLAVAVKIL